MGRRASSSAHPVWVLIAVVVLLAAIGGGYMLYRRVSDPYRTLTALPVQDYLQNSNSLRGNVYKLDATISASLEVSATGGRLFAVDVAGGNVLPILVPPRFNFLNIERGQRYLFRIEVAEKGIIRAQEVNKT